MYRMKLLVHSQTSTCSYTYIEPYNWWYFLTLKLLGIFFNVVRFFILFPRTVIFMCKTGPIQLIFSQHCGYWWPGPDSRNYPLAMGSDTIWWSWSADHIPQMSITIGSWDRENTKPNSYCQLKHDINHSLGNLELELWDCSWMKNIRLMTFIHDVTMGGVATSFMYANTRVSRSVQCMHMEFTIQ